MSNPIVAIAKESWDYGDQHACASEWLFQMCRLAAEFGVENDVRYRDPSGPVSLEWAVETGEDSAYWDAVLALVVDQRLLPHIDPDDHYTRALAADWANCDLPAGFSQERAAKHIGAALKTFDRIHRMTRED